MEKYFEEIPKIAITVSDTEGNVLDLNQRSISVNAKEIGKGLIGKSLYDCHPPRAAAIFRELYATERVNAYTIEKNGIKKLIYQTPWYEDGKFGGYVEFSLEIPMEMPHYVRTPKAE